MAHEILRDRGLVVNELTSAPGGGRKRRRLGGKIKLKEVMVFSRQFAAMINAGMNLMKCLDILKGQVTDPRFAKILGQVQLDVQAGQTLSQAMAKHPNAFNTLYACRW